MKINYSIKAKSPQSSEKPRWAGDTDWDYNEEITQQSSVTFALSRAVKFLDKHYPGGWKLTDSGQFVPLHGVGGGRVLLFIEARVVEDGTE